ncbi:MAG TPA: hypothetical protein VF800_02440 [Telluria sp.]
MRLHLSVIPLIFAGMNFMPIFSNAAELATGKTQPEIKAFKPAKQIAWSAGREILICDEGSRSGVTCQTALLPEALGEVSGVIQANFIPGRSSFLVQSQKGSTICASREGQTSVVCEPVKARFPVGVSISAKVLAGRIDVLQFVGSDDAKSKNSDELHRDVAQFSSAVSAATAALKAKMNRPPTHYSWGCDFDDRLPQKNDCGSNDGGGGGWDWTPGGNDGSYESRYSCTVGPIVVCTITERWPNPGASPNDGGLSPMGPATPTICGMTGFFCAVPGDVPLPPPETVEERKQGCDRKLDRDMDECKAYSRAMDQRSFRACRERAAQYHADCLRAAELP